MNMGFGPIKNASVCMSTSVAKRPRCQSSTAICKEVGADSLSTHCSIREYAGGSVRSIAHENYATSDEPKWQTTTATVVCIYNIGLQATMQSLYVNTTAGCAQACKAWAP